MWIKFTISIPLKRHGDMRNIGPSQGGTPTRNWFGLGTLKKAALTPVSGLHKNKKIEEDFISSIILT
jgi:hypothetical protein